MKTVIDFLKRYPTERSCLEYMMKDKSCPYCISNEFNYIRTRQKFQCKRCRRQFTPKTGTIFEQSNIPIQKWMLGIFLCEQNHNTSASCLSRQLDIGVKAAWGMLQKIKTIKS